MPRNLYLTLLLAATAAVGWCSPAFAQHASDEGAHILTMVVRIATREETLASGEDGALGLLRASGITDDEIRDGTVAGGVRFCCHEGTMMKTRLVFYVAPGFDVSVGDIVEIEIGRPGKRRRDTGTINRAVKVRESMREETGACHWDPEDERMWTRILYCTWMPAEGWQLERGLDEAWFKPAPASD